MSEVVGQHKLDTMGFFFGRLLVHFCFDIFYLIILFVMILGFVLRGRVMKLGVKHMGESREESEKYEASKNNTWLALSIFILILAHTHKTMNLKESKVRQMGESC